MGAMLSSGACPQEFEGAPSSAMSDESNSEGRSDATATAATAAGIVEPTPPPIPSSDGGVVIQSNGGATTPPALPPQPCPAAAGPTDSQLCDVADRLFNEAADKNLVTVGGIIESIARHFGVAKLDKGARTTIRGRLLALYAAVIDNEEGHCDSLDSDNSCDDDSDVELISPRTPASPEVIDLANDSSDDDQSHSCFWEYDAYGKKITSTGRAVTSQDAAVKSLFDDSSEGDASEEDDEVGAVGKRQDDEGADSDSDGSSSVEDVTDLMLAKRSEHAQKLIDDAEEIQDDSDQDCVENQKTVERKRRKVASSSSTSKRRRPRNVVESTIEVIIDEKDLPLCPGAKVSQDDENGSSCGDVSTDKRVDHSIKQRIVKLLNTGFHGESNEHEARNAMKLARRLMERYNLDQAMLLQERGDGSLNDFSTANDDDGSALHGGIVTAKIRNRKSTKPLSSLPRWHDFLIQTVCMNFHVEAFKTLARNSPRRTGECSVTFYGIRTNAQLAAYAFKISSERCSLMAAAYEPPRKMLPTRDQVVETRKARLSYALGIVNGLERDVKEGLRREEERRKEKLRKAQSAAKEGESYHQDSDSDIDGCGEEGVSDCQTKTTDDIGNSTIANEEANSTTITHLDKLERENTAHLALIDHHKKIASDVLKVRQSFLDAFHVLIFTKN